MALRSPAGHRGERPVPADRHPATLPPGERQLIVSFRTLHRPAADLVLGGALEATWQALTGGALRRSDGGRRSRPVRPGHGGS
ncbi:DUF6177 family protein [Streptomyces subrutilus]|uniref:DUF6177 family protein n=1 Tax=Streptomyces subrutilus TaxID=36818 RepID=UPI003263712A